MMIDFGSTKVHLIFEVCFQVGLRLNRYFCWSII